MECTDWDVFRIVCANIHEYTDVVTSYIHFCEELCIPTKTVKIFPNVKQWFSGDFRETVKKKKEAHRRGGRVLYKVKYEVQRAVRGAKVKYRRKLESQFLSNNHPCHRAGFTDHHWLQEEECRPLKCQSLASRRAQPLLQPL